MAGLVPGFVVAFALDVFVVGVIAKKIAFQLPIQQKEQDSVDFDDLQFDGFRDGHFHVLIRRPD